MKRTLWKLIAVFLAVLMSTGGTIAYLQDEDKDVNVMTLERVEIDLIEQERDEDGDLVDFQDDHRLIPGVHADDLTVGKDGYWTDVRNEVDKIVTVKNTGKAPAYIRIWFAFEVTDEDDFFDEKLHLNRNTSDWDWVFLKDANGGYRYLEQDGARYVVAAATYPEILEANEVTPVSLRQVLLDRSATNADYLKLGDKYSILVVAQGMQTDGFDTANEALDEGFGEVSMANHPFAGMREDDASGSSGAYTIYPAEKVDWFTGGIQQLLPKGAVFEIYDVETEIVWKAKRGTGNNHAEIEPYTAADTAKLCEIYGVDTAQEIVDKNLYQRRPCLVTVDGRTFACSLYGVPHNSDLDTIVDNNMDGVLCLFFSNSTNHAGAVDSTHEAAIESAYQNAPNGQKNSASESSVEALVINTPEELIAFSKTVSSEEYLFVNRTVALGSDIDMTGYDWSPIMVWDNTFQGVFDGRGHTISNLTGSLFGHVFSYGELSIKNVTIDDAVIEESSAGAILGSNFPYSNVTIDNCHVTNTTIKALDAGEYCRAGGIAGDMSDGSIKNCSVRNCSVYTTKIAGQLVGETWGTQITNCTVDQVKLYQTVDGSSSTYSPSSFDCGTAKGVIHEELLFDQDAHHRVCSACGGDYGDDSCIEDCANPGVCILCGQTDGSSWRGFHHWEQTGSSTTLHEIACGECGEILRGEEHHAYCQEADQNICAGCGASGVNIGSVWHNTGYINITDDTHDRGCPACGEVTRTEAHRYYSDSTHCELCGAARPERYVIVLRDNVSLRRGATTSSVVVARVSIGTTLRYHALTDGWYQVEYNGSTCYIMASLVQEVPKPTTYEVSITAETTNLYEEASASAAVLAQMPKETVVPFFEEVTKNGTKWYYVFYNGQMGYVKATDGELGGNG